MSYPDPLATLFLAVESYLAAQSADEVEGLPDVLEDSGPILFLNGQYHPLLKGFSVENRDIWQYFRPYADILHVNGVASLENLPNGRKYTLILVLLPKQGAEARFFLAEALTRLCDEGRVIVAAANDAGGGRLEAWLKELGCTPLAATTKNKARAVLAYADNVVRPTLDAWCEGGAVRLLELAPKQAFYTRPGLFGWDKIDTGSRLLAENMPDDLTGRGADFGCGYGFLARTLLSGRYKGVKALTMIDADARALECAALNVKDVQADRPVDLLWHDLSRPLGGQKIFDFIVMNPPFHEGKKTVSDLGTAFIRTARTHLHRGGRLYMVANSHLPYEAVLAEAFHHVRQVAQRDGFKVIEAVA